MKKFLKIVGIVFLVIIAIIIIFITILYNRAKSTGLGSGTVADIERKINIWNEVPSNSNKSKLDDMNINYDENLFISTLSFANAIVGDKYIDKEKEIDTFTYLYEIQQGFEKETYEDEPYIIPYLVEGSDSAVIVIPGGGFAYKSMDGTTGEGKDIAETLNKNGINAFVLHYRTNPYEYPVPYLDLQRAVRYLKYHAEEYHIDKNKISMIGGSAGGNLVGMYINKIMGSDLLPSEYVKDEIDLVDDSISLAAMLYPAISFNDNIPMLFAMFNSNDVRDENLRNELLNQMDLIKNFNSSNVKQFIAYGTKDTMVGTSEIEKYINVAKNNNTDIHVMVAKGQGHGFAQEYYMNDYIKWFKENVK